MAKKRKQQSNVSESKRRSESPPGTIAPHSNALKPEISVIAYGPDVFEERSFHEDARELKTLHAKTPVLWININGVGDVDTFTELGEIFNLHALALEDTVNLRQRPKFEEYDAHSYIALRMLRPGDEIRFEQVSLFLGDGYVITVQEQPGDCLEPLRRRIRDSRGRIRNYSSDYLAYAVIDAIVDNYFPVVEKLTLRLEDLEEDIIQSPDDETVGEVHLVRRDLHALRRILAPTREAVALMIREETPHLTDKTRVFLRDCQDHTTQLLDSVEAGRELSASLMDLHQSGISNRLNEIMKVLTLIATIFMPLGFIAGVYGMNFDSSSSPWNMPELGWYFGYPLALSLMATTSICFLIFFIRRGWIGRRRSKYASRQKSE